MTTEPTAPVNVSVTPTTEELLQNIINRIECYKAELINDIESGMFYTARSTLNKCIKEINDYRVQYEEDRK